MDSYGTGIHSGMKVQQITCKLSFVSKPRLLDHDEKMQVASTIQSRSTQCSVDCTPVRYWMGSRGVEMVDNTVENVS